MPAPDPVTTPSSDAKPLRVLIATATAGGGHLAAARALSETWQSLRTRDSVQLLDVVQMLSPLHRKAYTEGYIKFVEEAPSLWGAIFERTDHPEIIEQLNWLRQIFPSSSRREFSKLLETFRPGVLLCTHFLPLELLNAIERASDSGPAPAPFAVSVVTDFEVHALWMQPCVDLYAVAAEHSKHRLLARGVAAEKIVATGIPIGGPFTHPPSRLEARSRLELDSTIPVLLMLSGGFGMGPVEEALRLVNKVERPLQTIVVTGRNEALRERLAALPMRHPTRVLGFATNMHELMAAADLILTKPGGLTTAEALASGRPLLILNPIPGQEAANSDFLLEHGAAAKLNRLEDLPFRLDQLLGSLQLERMSAAAADLGRPDAAARICRETATRISARLLG